MIDDMTDGEIGVKMAETFARLKAKFPPIFHAEGQEWWWPALALCDALDIYDPDRAIADLDSNSKVIGTVSSPDGTYDILCVNEIGFQQLMLMSHRPKVLKETAWIWMTALPRALRGKRRDRKTGKLVPRPERPHKTIEQLLERKGRFNTPGEFLAYQEDTGYRCTRCGKPTGFVEVMDFLESFGLFEDAAAPVICGECVQELEEREDV